MCQSFFNFCAISHNYHVLDRSPMALLKLVLEKHFSGPATVSQYSALFKKFIHESANRAQRRDVPLSYQEILTIWNTFIAPNNMSRATIEAIVENRLNFNKSPGLKFQPQGNRAQGNRGRAGGPSAKKPRLKFCNSWNFNTSLPLCTNTPATGGCMDANGEFLTHSCSYQDRYTRQTCKSDKHGLKLH